jgi:hypothetical protein
MKVSKLLGVTLAVLAVSVVSSVGSAQGLDPRACPAGWIAATDRVDIPATGVSGRNYKRVTLKVDIPAASPVLTIHPAAQHPKFCWKEATSFQWRCFHTDPWEGEWFRFESFRPDQASPYGLGFKRYTLVAQNESHDRIRNAQFVVCYQRPASTATSSAVRIKPGVVRDK